MATPASSGALTGWKLTPSTITVAREGVKAVVVWQRRAALVWRRRAELRLCSLAPAHFVILFARDNLFLHPPFHTFSNALLPIQMHKDSRRAGSHPFCSSLRQLVSPTTRTSHILHVNLQLCSCIICVPPMLRESHSVSFAWRVVSRRVKNGACQNGVLSHVVRIRAPWRVRFSLLRLVQVEGRLCR